MPLPRNKVQSYSTIQRTIHRLNPNEICESFNNWMAQYSIPEPIAADGKSITSTVKNATNYISSAKQSAWCFANEIRCHRKIENSLHWTKDIVQNEDNCGLSETKAAVNMEAMRDISFNLLVMNGFKSISEGIMELEPQCHLV